MSEVIRKNNPTVGDVHYSQPLTYTAMAYKQSGASFVASRLFPGVGVQKASDVFYKWAKKSFLEAYAKPRAPSSETAGGSMSFTTDNYSCKVYGFHFDIDDQVRANADSQLTLDAAATEMVMGALLREKERLFLANFFKSSVWGTDWTGKSSNPSTNEFLQWDAANSTPRKNIEAAKTTVLAATGVEPNTLLLGRQVYAALLTNADIKDQFKYTSADSINESMIARYFGVQNVLVGDAVATSDNGATYGFMAGKNALLCYVTPNPGALTVTAGYTFEWSGYTGAMGGVRMSRMRMDPIRSDRIEGEYAWDMKLVANDLGFFFSGAIA
jgi:hypothetical protein